MAPERSPDQSCDVYWGHLSWLRPAHVKLLSAPEVSRRQRFRRENDRHRFTAAAALLRVVVGNRTGLAPVAVQVDRTCRRCAEPHGRPRIVGQNIEVSIAHSGDFVAVAVTTAGPVGVDLEQVRPLDHMGLWDEVCGPTERRGSASLASFYSTWTRKESILKATGVGLELPMAEVRVTPASEFPRLLAYPSHPPLSARIADVSPADGYAGAVTVLTGAHVAFREWDGREVFCVS